MPDERIKEIYDSTKKNRVVIFRREADSFYYEVEYFSEHPLEMCWTSSNQHPVGIYENKEVAEREVRANVDWLKTETEAKRR